MSDSPLSTPGLNRVDLVVDSFVAVPSPRAGASPLRAAGDVLLYRGEVVVARRFTAASHDGSEQRVLWLKCSTQPRLCRDPWNSFRLQLLAHERRWVVAMSYCEPTTVEEALRLARMAADADALIETLRRSGSLALAYRLCDPQRGDEVDGLLEPVPGEPAPLPSLDATDARVLLGTPLAQSPFCEPKYTLYVPGAAEQQEARVEQEPWLTPTGAGHARAALERSLTARIRLAEAVEQVLAMKKAGGRLPSDLRSNAARGD